MVQLVTQEQPDSDLDPRRWILSHVEYTGGRRLPRHNVVEPAVLSILVADILDCGRRAELRRTDRYHNAAAFPDPEGLRKNKKFSVRFAVSGIPCACQSRRPRRSRRSTVHGSFFERTPHTIQRIPQI